MAESLSPPAPAEPSREAEVYRPLSGLAVAAFAVAVLYAVIFAIVVVSSVLSRSPLFLSPWTLILPAGAVGLALAARQHIRYAEGTRSGEALATWAIRLSTIGLIYLAIYVATFMAVKWQAERFVEQWFQRIRQGKLAEAFLETRKPDERAGEDPADKPRLQARYGNVGGRRGELPRFLEWDLVQELQNENASIEELGVRELEYEQGGYRVQLSYRITTPEGAYDWLVTVRSTDTRKDRNWTVLFTEGETRLSEKPQLTPLGQAHRQMRDEALRFAYETANHRSQGNLVDFYLATLAPAKSREMSEALRARLAGLLLSAGSHGAIPVLTGVFAREPLEMAAAPGFAEFQQGGIIGSEQLEEAGDRRTAILSAAPLFCRSDMEVTVRVGEMGAVKLSVVPGTSLVRCEKDVEFTVVDKDPAALPGPKISAEARFIMEGTPAANGSTHWRLARVELLREKPADDARGGRPPGARPARP